MIREQVNVKVHDDLYMCALITDVSSHIKDKWNVELFILLPPFVKGTKWAQFGGVSYSMNAPLENVKADATNRMRNFIKIIQASEAE